jgi:hypothetical protein
VYDTLREKMIRFEETSIDSWVIGHTDGGRMTFFAPKDFRVVNLDGKINNAAAEAIEDGQLVDFIVGGPIRYVIMRRRLGDVEGVMGRGFRRHFRLDNIRRDDLTAYVLREEREIVGNILLPDDGIIQPWNKEHWSFLLGEWRMDFGELSKIRVGVKDVGFQFAVEEKGALDIELIISLAIRNYSPSVLPTVELNGVPIGIVNYRGVDFVRLGFEVEERLVRSGINELTLENIDPVSPRILGMNADTSIAIARIRQVRILRSRSEG